jgi:putative ABC transport system permease protein
MLFRKLIRTMGQYKAQFISMVIMIALGIGVFVGFNMDWYSLERDTNKVYAETGFSDFRIVSEEGFTEDDLDAVMEIDGVEDATRYISVTPR